MNTSKLAQIVYMSDELSLGDFTCAIGVFDGMHEGHRYVIGEAVNQAKELGVGSVAITFDRDPDELFLGLEQQRKLLTNQDRIAHLALSGVDMVLVIPFDAVFAAATPLEFLNASIAVHGRALGIHVGADFRFGHRATGGVDELRLWAARRGCGIFAHNLLADEGLSVTSTRIRNALEQGQLGLANQLLTRPHYLWAKVVPGRSLGRELGFPTANLEPEPMLVQPADGVYAGLVAVDGRLYRSAVSVGLPATFEVAAPTIEAHILDFDGDIYGQQVQLFFINYLRPMRSFSSVQELVATVNTNIEQARHAEMPIALLTELVGNISKLREILLS